jgi:hypothetical protein
MDLTSLDVITLAEITARAIGGESQNAIATAVGLTRGEVCSYLRVAKYFGHCGGDSDWESMSENERDFSWELEDELDIAIDQIYGPAIGNTLGEKVQYRLAQWKK